VALLLRMKWECPVAWRSIDAAETDLASFHSSLVQEMDSAFAEFLEVTRPIAPRLTASTKASIYRDLAVRRMREWCDRTPGAEFISRGQLGVVGLSNNWLIRIKKMRAGFKVAVSPTNASEAYDQNDVPQSIARWLLEEPPATCLYLAWFLPENAPTRVGKFLICNDEEGLRSWVRALDDGSDPPAPNLDLIPLAPPPTPPDQPRRVRVRGERERKTNE
jgi:hypothetical protein